MNPLPYVGLGHTGGPADFYSYNQAKNNWTAVTSLPGNERSESVSFVIGNKAFVGLGFVVGSGLLNDFWEFDPGVTLTHNLSSLDKELTIFPNPVNDKLSISFPTHEPNQIELKIFNSYGLEVFKKQILNSKKIDPLNISELTTGIYFVHATTDKGTAYAKKIVIVK